MAWTFKDWYDKHSKELSRKRKLKYKRDKLHRERIQRKSRSYYKNHSKDRIPADRLSVRDTDGVHYITIGKMAKMIGRKAQTLRGYHVDLVIPPCTVFDHRGWRLYSPKQAMLIRKAFGMYDRDEISMLSGVGKFLANNWEGKDGKEDAKTS